MRRRDGITMGEEEAKGYGLILELIKQQIQNTDSHFTRLYEQFDRTNDRLNILDKDSVTRAEHEKALQQILKSFESVANETKSALSQLARINPLVDDIYPREDLERRLGVIEEALNNRVEEKKVRRQNLINTLIAVGSGVFSSVALTAGEYWLLIQQIKLIHK